MSQYIILRKNHKANPYSNTKSPELYEVFIHTRTKYANNEPYWSSNLSCLERDNRSISKEHIAAMLKLAQNHIPSYRTQPKKSSKSGHIFVLKLNSTKLKQILANN